MAGAMFAMAIIVIAYLFNDTVMLPEDIEKKILYNKLANTYDDIKRYVIDNYME